MKPQSSQQQPAPYPAQEKGLSNGLVRLVSEPEEISSLKKPTSAASLVSANVFDSQADTHDSPDPSMVRYKHENIRPGDLIPVYQSEDEKASGEKQPQMLIRKWPSVLMQLMSENNDDLWLPAIERMMRYPHEIMIQGRNGGMNALHAACLRYPPLHVIEAIMALAPEAVLVQNHAGESPMHLASYSASEEVQIVLAHAAPEAVALLDQYGDTPLHFAARLGATRFLMETFLKAAPHCISKPNQRGVAPFWTIARSFLEAESLEEIFEDNEDYLDDWNMMVLFLKYSYKYNCDVDIELPAQDDENLSAEDLIASYRWVVHAAASTPACPLEVLRFLCRMYPDEALTLDANGMTPLHIACKTIALKEPEEWNENEDGFREPVQVAEGELHNASHEVDQKDVKLEKAGDVAFIEQATRESESEEQESAISILLEWSPRSALLQTSAGDLPLNLALSSGLPWSETRKLVAAYPRALLVRDRSGFHMFQKAAMHSPDLTTVYSLTRSLPELLATAKKEDSIERPNKRQKVEA